MKINVINKYNYNKKMIWPKFKRELVWQPVTQHFKTAEIKLSSSNCNGKGDNRVLL